MLWKRLQMLTCSLHRQLKAHLADGRRQQSCQVQLDANPLRLIPVAQVIVVEDENGNIVRESMKDTDVVARYKTMHETLVYLCHLDHEDTEAQMLEKLRVHVSPSTPAHSCQLALAFWPCMPDQGWKGSGPHASQDARRNCQVPGACWGPV